MEDANGVRFAPVDTIRVDVLGGVFTFGKA